MSKVQTLRQTEKIMHYIKPGQITVSTLLENRCDDKDFVILRDDLMEHHDYEAVIPEIWNLLVGWYGFATNQTPIMRFISFDKRSGKYYVDLYLEQNRDLSNIYQETEDVMLEVEESSTY